MIFTKFIDYTLQMKRHFTSLFSLFVSCLFISFTLCTDLNADTTSNSKRIEVYSISQSFWDVKRGDSLSEIVLQLLPDNTSKREKLFNEILRVNPQAFIQNNPDKLKANVRLWLSNGSAVRETPDLSNKYEIRSFDWGQVYRVKR